MWNMARMAFNSDIGNEGEKEVLVFVWEKERGSNKFKRFLLISYSASPPNTHMHTEKAKDLSYADREAEG